MQILRVVTFAGIAAAAYGQASPRPEVVEVRAVIDGRTIDVAGRGRVRLAGIQTPALARGAGDDEPLAREARDRLEGMVAHRFVRLEFPSSASQSAAYVLLEDGTFVNAVLAREGLARVTARRGGVREDELVRAEATAKEMRRGLWRR
jgi:micrococcal nuclease